MPLTRTELAALANLLDRRHEALLEEVRDELEASEKQQYVELLDRSPADAGDQSMADALADLNLAMIDRHVDELRDIEGARERMLDGTYGQCIACGEDIDIERLRAYPTAKRCLRDQRRYEQSHAGGGTPSL